MFKVSGGPPQSVVRESGPTVPLVQEGATKLSAFAAGQLNRAGPRARVAVLVLFAAFGVTIGTWAVHLPELKESVGLTAGQLGTVLLAVGVGAVVGMQVGGRLSDRFGSGPVSLISVTAMALAVVVPMCAASMAQAMVAAVVFGICVGTGDVAMNVAAVEVERDYERPIMGLFHGFFSVGTALGSLGSAVGFAVQAKAPVVTLIIGLVSAGALIAVKPALWRRWMGSGPAQVEAPLEESSEPVDKSARWRRLAVLGALSFLLFLAEGSAMDWSSLHAQEHRGASPTTGTMAFTAFVVAMTIGRFTIDRIADRVGAVRVLRWGSAVATAGAVLVVYTDSLILTLVGWAIFGLGICGGIPQVFTAAGAVSGGSGKELSYVVGLGYVATLSGPAVIGWLAEFVSLNQALIVVPVAVLICACGAGAVDGARLGAREPTADDDSRQG